MFITQLIKWIIKSSLISIGLFCAFPMVFPEQLNIHRIADKSRIHVMETKVRSKPWSQMGARISLGGSGYFSWWRHQMETFSALLALCEGNSPVTCELSSQRPVARSFDVFFDLRLNKRLSKQPWGWWFETLSHSLWRHCNVSLGLWLTVDLNHQNGFPANNRGLKDSQQAIVVSHRKGVTMPC